MTDEAAIIQRVLKVVKTQELQRREQGLSNCHFTLGVMNCWLVTVVFAKFPQHFWLLYLVEASYLIPHKMRIDYRHKPLNQILYYLDYCWVMNFLILLALYSISFMGDALPYTVRLQIYQTAVGVGTGPMVIATAALPFVAVVFHDSAAMTAVFIHLMPPMVVYTVLHHGIEIRQAWPTIFLNTFDDQVQFWPDRMLPFPGMGTVYGNSVALYVTWWMLYVVWQITVGLDLPRKHRRSRGKDGNPLPAKYDTVFHSTVRGGLSAFIGKVCWKRSLEESQRQMREDDYEVRDMIVYMMGHGLGIIGIASTVVSPLCFQNQHVYAVVLALLTTLVVYRGALRYTYWVTSMSSHAIEKEFVDQLGEKKSK